MSITIKVKNNVPNAKQKLEEKIAKLEHRLAEKKDSLNEYQRVHDVLLKEEGPSHLLNECIQKRESIEKNKNEAEKLLENIVSAIQKTNNDIVLTNEILNKHSNDNQSLTSSLTDANDNEKNIESVEKNSSARKNIYENGKKELNRLSQLKATLEKMKQKNEDIIQSFDEEKQANDNTIKERESYYEKKGEIEKIIEAHKNEINKINQEIKLANDKSKKSINNVSTDPKSNNPMASAASPANKNSNLRLWKAEHCEIAELKENELFGVRNVEGQSQQFGDFEMGADKLAAIELIDHIMDMCQPNQTIELVSGDPETLAVMYLRARFHENYNEGMIEIKDEVLAQVVDHKDKIEKNKECLNFINDKKFNPAEEIKNNQKDEASNKHQENGENENHPRPPRS